MYHLFIFISQVLEIKVNIGKKNIYPKNNLLNLYLDLKSEQNNNSQQ